MSLTGTLSVTDTAEPRLCHQPPLGVQGPCWGLYYRCLYTYMQTIWHICSCRCASACFLDQGFPVISGPLVGSALLSVPLCLVVVFARIGPSCIVGLFHIVGSHCMVPLSEGLLCQLTLH